MFSQSSSDSMKVQVFNTGCFYAPALTITGVSLYSCVAHIQPVLPAQGRGCQHLLAEEE